MVIPSLLSEGHYRHPWLGINGYTLSPELVEALDLPTEHGALVAAVVEDSPAAQAGVQGGTQETEVPGYPEPIPAGGDIIIAIDGSQVHGMDDIITYLQHTTVGQVVTLTAIRGGEQIAIEVELGERPAN
jgi:2-alkenal reductase